MEDIDLSFPSQVVVTPKILGDAMTSMMELVNTDPDKMGRLGLGLVMFVEILKISSREEE